MKWMEHKQKWNGCTLCPLCQNPGRKTVVLARGRVPCDVLFIGEAPGTSENALGQPFVGPAGKLLDDIIWDACNVPGTTGWDYCTVRVAFTNLVACIPLGDDGNKMEQPPAESIVACAPRLQEFVGMAKPKLIVCVGQLSLEWVGGTKKNGSVLQPHKIPLIHIVHPAAILRSDIAQQSLAIKRCVVTIADVVRGL